MTKATPRRDIHEEITAKIVAAIEAGADHFQMPWHRAASMGRPVNAATGKPYNGVNVLSLWVSQQAAGYFSPEWATYKQWESIGAQVRKGEKSSLVVFYKSYDVADDADGPDAVEGELTRRMFARASWVFNAAQVDGYTPKVKPPEAKPVTTLPVEALAEVDAFIAATGAEIRHGGDRAFYKPFGDYIQMPEREAFFGSDTSSPTESYYSTLLHELTHWTGPQSRCNREFGKRFGDEAYAFEELVAELGAAYMCAGLGVTVDPRLDHAAYIKSWLKVLKDDNRAIFTAASKATEAVKFLTDKSLSLTPTPSVEADATAEAVQEPEPVAAKALPEGWTGYVGGIATNLDPVNGGIVDKAIATGQWFFVPNLEGLETKHGFASQSEAFTALADAVAEAMTAPKESAPTVKAPEANATTNFAAEKPKTFVKKGRDAWEASTTLPLCTAKTATGATGTRYLEISTSKFGRGAATRACTYIEVDRGHGMVSRERTILGDDFYKTISEVPSLRLTEKAVETEHAKALAVFDGIEAEARAFYGLPAKVAPAPAAVLSGFEAMADNHRRMTESQPRNRAEDKAQKPAANPAQLALAL